MGFSIFGSAADAAHETEPIFRFEAGPYRAGQLRVVRFRGRERVNGLFEFSVELAAPEVELLTLETAVLGQSASLVIGNGPTRVVHGVVAAVDYAGVHTGSDHPRVIMKLVPRAWLLKHKRNSRVFQERSTQEIVSILLKEHRVAYRWQLMGTYGKRTYCVQYQETDWEFVTRLVAEEGMFFFFEHPPAALSELDGMTGGVASMVGAAASLASSVVGGAVGDALGTAGGLLDMMETLNFGDRPEVYPPIAADGDLDVNALAQEAAVRTGALAAVSALSSATGVTVGVSPVLRIHADDGMPPHEDEISEFGARRVVRPKSVLTRQYDFKKPRLDVRGEAAVDPGAGAQVSLGIGSGGLSPTVAADLPLAILPAELKQYHHHAEDEELDSSRARARMLLEQDRADRRRGRGRSWCLRLVPGARFTLDGHGIPQVDREYVVTQVVHEGTTATHFGVGGRGDAATSVERYFNRFECVPSSTPVRPRKPAPRMFQVLEPARVVGPATEEIHTDEFGRIKVQFFWDNEGAFNEFSSCWIRVVQNWSGGAWGFQFIPRIGMEVMVSFQHGDQDRPVVLGTVYNGENAFPFALPDDKTRSGIRSQSSPGGGGYNELSFQDQAGREQLYIRAQRDLDEMVSHDHTIRVNHDERDTVGNDQTVAVNRDQHSRVGRNRSVDVTGTSSYTVGAGRSTRIGGTDHLLVERHGFLTTRENYNLQVGRVFNTYVGTDDEPGGINTWAWGPTQFGTNATHTFDAQDKITLRVGDSVIELTRDTITLRAPHVIIDGTEDTLIRGKDPMIKLTDTALIVSKEIKAQSKGVTVTMDDKLFKVEAPAHVLTSGSGADADERKKVTGETKPFKLKLSNSLFEPYASRPYELVVGTTKFTGTTDGSGQISEEVPKEATNATVQLWIGDPPTGATRIIQVALVDAVPPSSGTPGIKLRLSHLGYYQGEIDDVVDPGLHEAVRQFQQDHDMEITGVPADIAGRLTDVHGS